MATIMNPPMLETVSPNQIVDVPLNLFSIIKTSIRRLFFKKGRQTIYQNDVDKVIDVLRYSLDILGEVEKQVIEQVISDVTQGNYQQALAQLFVLNYLAEPIQEAMPLKEFLTLNYLIEPPLLD